MAMRVFIRPFILLCVSSWLSTISHPGVDAFVVPFHHRAQRTPTAPTLKMPFAFNTHSSNSKCCRASDSVRALHAFPPDNGGGGDNEEKDSSFSWESMISAMSDNRSLTFSAAMTIAGAMLGPFLDSYHSAFGVLEYKQPIGAILWGSAQYPALTTTWWVPALFGLAGFIIGWLYILLDAAIVSEKQVVVSKQPSAPRVLIAISLFTLQYWLSGALYQGGVDRTTILNVMSVIAASGFAMLDSTLTGFIVSAATAISGPLIEVGLLTLSKMGTLVAGYRYTDLGETGFFPLWILPVYFLGGPAVGLLARWIWNAIGKAAELSEISDTQAKPPPGCQQCGDTRRVPCPNCEGMGTYVAMGGRSVKCTSCRGRGFVICRSCFSYYDEDPADIESIRDLMSRMPD